MKLTMLVAGAEPVSSKTASYFRRRLGFGSRSEQNYRTPDLEEVSVSEA